MAETNPVPWQTLLVAPMALRAGHALGRPVMLTLAEPTSPVSSAGRLDPAQSLAYETALAGPYPGGVRVIVGATEARGLAGLSGGEGEDPEILAKAVAEFGQALAEGLAAAAASLLGEPVTLAADAAPVPPPGAFLALTLTAGGVEAAAVDLCVPEALVAAVGQALPPPAGVGVRPARFPVLEPTAAPADAQAGVERLLEVPFTLTARLGSAVRRVDELTRIGVGSLIELDRMAGEPVDLYVNDVWVGRGEVVVVDENFAVRITDLGSPAERLGLGPSASGGGVWGAR